jgi:hypothetical protein
LSSAFYPSGLDVALVIQPALDVYFYLLEGDMLFLGTTGTVQLELKNRAGDMYDPGDDILIELFAVDDTNQVATSPTISGPAVQEELECVLQPGRYFFDFDTAVFSPASGPAPPRALIRASIPYGGSLVLWQRTVQLQPVNDVS